MGLLLSLLLLFGSPATAAVYTWVDEDGVTHIADDPAALPEHTGDAAREGRESTRDRGMGGERRQKLSYQLFSSIKYKKENYEKTLEILANSKKNTDIFFDNVIVNDENESIKANRLELLKMFCMTLDNFIDFSKMEGS